MTGIAKVFKKYVLSCAITTSWNLNTNLNKLSNSDLLIQSKNAARSVRDSAQRVLECLKEIETRLLHLESGYPSLYEYVVSELKYSRGPAYRRIQGVGKNYLTI